MTDEEDLLGTLFANRFHIEALLGSGGMGSVYLARHEVLQRLFALKVIRSEMLNDANVTARFRREARAASRVQHPNIIQIVDFGQDEDGRLYLAMEYAEGPTLAEAVAAGPFPVPRVLHLLDQIADALRAAHASDVIHRDLKPVNILLSSSPAGEPDHVKILDFGLAKILDPFSTAGLSAHGQLFGTPEYMSPERCMDAPADHRTDIYSLGIIAFELLAGRVPFKGRVVETISAHMTQDPPPPSTASARQDIPAELDGLVLRCLAKEPEQRFQSAGQLLAAIRGLRSGPTAPAAHKEKDWRAQLLETLPPEDMIEAPASPDAEVHDTVVIQRPHERADAPTLVRFVEGLEQLAYALRDRGIGSPEVTCRLALLVESRDQQLEARSQLQMLQVQVEELQMTSRIRESRLSQVLHQLTHELSQAAPSRPGQARELQARINAVASRIQEIGDDLRFQEADIGERCEQLRESLGQLTAELRHRAEQLRDAVKQLVQRLNLSGDLELTRLIRNARLL